MPNRIIREGILTSDRVDQLDAPAEVFYRRLMSKVDDHGLYDARPSVLRSSLYPLRVDRVREADISRSLAACQSAGLIALYQHAGKPYLQMLDTRWQARSEAKYPLPGAVEMRTSENGCAQPLTTAPVFVGVVADVVESVEDKGRKRPKFDAAKVDLPPWLDRALWCIWVEDRKARGKALTEAGAKAQIRKLETYRAQGHGPEAVIEHSIAGGYQGLFPDNSAGQRPGQPAETAWQRSQRERAAEVSGGLVSRKPPGPETIDNEVPHAALALRVG